MKTLDDFLAIDGDSFAKLSPLVSAIQSRISQHGLDAWDSPDSELDRVSTWEERAIVRLTSFHCVCSNNGRVYPHIDYGLSLIPEFEAVGATETIHALRELERLRETEPDLEESPTRLLIEDRVPGDFVWADPIIEYVRRHSDRFLQHQVLAPLQSMSDRDIPQQRHDPDFGTVNNAKPSHEFAFEIPGKLTVGQVAAFTDAEAAQQITGVDDYGNPVLEIPLGQTSRALFFHFCDRTVSPPFKEDSVPVAFFIHVIALLLVHKICEHPDKFGLGMTRDEVLALPFHRFYYDRTDHWWDVIFGRFTDATGKEA
jgi:hypothetical protein